MNALEDVSMAAIEKQVNIIQPESPNDRANVVIHTQDPFFLGFFLFKGENEVFKKT